MPRTTKTLKRFGDNTSGVSAVEFAVLLPVMTLLLLGSFDIARAITAKSKASQLASTISDFVSQNTTISQAELDGILAASKAVLHPFPDDSTVLAVKVESVRWRTSPTPARYVVDWSYEAKGGTKTAIGTDNTTIPLTPVDTSTILATVDYTYKLKFAKFLGTRLGLTEFKMKSSTHTSPRWGTPIEASGFP